MTAPDDGFQPVTDSPHGGGRDVTAARPAKTSAAADRIQHYIDDARGKLPGTQQVRSQLPAK